MGVGWGITSTLLAGILVFGGLGYLLDRLVGTSRVFEAAGVVLGAGAGNYIVYLRYAKADGEQNRS